MGDGIVLWDYWRSSSAYRLRIALNLLGLAHEIVPVDLVAGEQRSEAHLARNPQGLVPAVAIDGVVLTQSLAVLEYLDEVHGAGLLPADPLGRVRVRTLAHAVAMEIQPVCNLRVAKHAVGLAPGLTTEAWMRHFIGLGLEGLEALLGRGPDGPYCHGSRVTMADVCLVPQVYNARRWGMSLDRFPRIAAISERLEALPPIAAAQPDRVRPGG